MVGFFRGGVRELAIARPDEAKGLVVFKHPDQTIPMKAQLTVDADELALFFKDGKLVGQFGPGRHTLDGASVPFLGQLVDHFTGGNVFICEVYFVTVREMTDVKFGGPIGKVRDVQSGLLVQMMVHGTFSARVLDPTKLVVGLTGLQKQDGNAFLTWFRQLTLKEIKEHIAELCVAKKWPLPDVTSGAYTSEIEAATLTGLRADVDGYGLEVVRFGDFHIAMGEDDEKKLSAFYEKAGYMNMAGGLSGYQQFAQAEMMRGAGEGMARGGNAGGAMDGAGIGLGIAMAGNMLANQGGGGGRDGAQAQAQTPASEMRAGQVTCGGCGATVAPGKFCPECGKALAAGPRFCGGCGSKVSGKFCAECGAAAT